MRYYSTQRPVAPGTYPRKGAQEVVNFERRVHVKAIGRPAWGYIIYDRELTDKEVEDYELTKEETRPVEVARVTISEDVEMVVVRDRSREYNPYRIFEVVPYTGGTRKRFVEEYAMLKDALRYIMALCPEE